jgi:hypothetical protein
VFGLLHEALQGQNLANDDKGRGVYKALIAIENFLSGRYQKACELLHNALKKGVITLRNDALCICHRLLYKKLVIQSLYLLTLPHNCRFFFSLPRNEVVTVWLLIFHALYTIFLLLSAK